MTLRQIVFFITVCEKRSITRAAQHHFVSQQSMSKTVQDLEAELGAELLVRSNQGVELTPCGAYVYKAGRELMEQVERMRSTVEQMKGAYAERIRFGAAYGAMSALGPELLMGFCREYPHIDLQVQDLPDLYCEEKLRAGALDVICTLGPLDERAFRFIHLKTERMYLCVAEGDPLYGRERLCMEDLRDRPFLCSGPRFRGYHMLRASCARAGFAMNLSFTSNEFNLLEEMSMRGLGLFPMPSHTLRQGLSGVRYLPFPDPEFAWRLYLAVPKEAPLSRGVERFMGYLEQGTRHYREQG